MSRLYFGKFNLKLIKCGEYSNVHIYRLLDSVYNSLTKNGVYICVSYG